MFSIKIDDHLRTARNRRIKIPHQVQLRDSDQSQVARSPRANLIFSSRFYIAIVVTLILIASQLLLIHYIISSTRARKLFTPYHSDDGGRMEQDWDCICPYFSDVRNLANRFGVDLVVVDPDLLKSLELDSGDLPNSDVDTVIDFSRPSKQYQESTDKIIFHLAAINETSGGQPNLKLFYNALKNNGYTVLKYHDTSQVMQPEVYKRPSHLFDDMPLDGVRWHKYSHDSSFLQDESVKTHDDYYPEASQHGDEVSKIYTEFISHIFILNTTQIYNEEFKENLRICNHQLGSTQFPVIHILVLYNHDHDPSRWWIQSSLQMNELDKHKLLSYKVHSFDFKVPIEETYIHEKRIIVNKVKPGSSRARLKRSSENQIRVFEPEGDRLLRFVNNSYVFCKLNQFNISGSIDNPRRMSNYLIELDNTRPLTELEDVESIRSQLNVALQFMDTFSKAYGNFSYWITGGSLLAYHKHCSLAVVPELFAANKMRLTDKQVSEMEYSSENILINLELGLFSSEVNDSILNDLANANAIGVIMMSDWSKTNSPITFQFRDCPNLLFNLYLYELRKDFYQYYFVTRNTMTMMHKFNKRQTIDNSRTLSYGHHVFNTNNLNLCWTRCDNLNPFRIPCNIHDHLRRIYII